MRPLSLLAVFFLALVPVSRAGEAARPPGYPSRPIAAIVPFAEGGGLDVSMRILARYAGEELGEPVHVVNMTRGGNIFGNLHAIRAEPDGHVLGVWGMGLVTDELLIPNCPYTHRDVAPVCLYAEDPHVIAVGAAFARRHGIATLEDLFTYVRAHPGRVTFGSGGNWTSHDFVRLRMEQLAGIKFVRMPFLGGAPALRAAAAGNCDVVAPFLPELLPLLSSGNVVPLAVAYPTRLARLPDVPTTAEAGYPGMTQTIWRVVTLPAAAAPELVAYLGDVFRRAAARPEYVRDAEAAGINPVFKGPEGLAAFLEDEFLRAAAITEEWGVGADR